MCINNKNNNYDEHDLAICIACKKFDEMHPKETLPEWLKYCMSMKVVRNQNDNWVIKLVLMPKIKLKNNQYWQWESDGIPILIEVDPLTEKKSVVICGGPAAGVEIFFEIEVDLVKNSSLVIIDIDPNKLDGTKYEINRRWFT